MKKQRGLLPEELEKIVKKEEEKEARRTEVKYFLGLTGWSLLMLVVIACIITFILFCLGVFS